MIGFPRHQDWRRQELVLHRLESLLAFFGPHKLDTSRRPDPVLQCDSPLCLTSGLYRRLTFSMPTLRTSTSLNARLPSVVSWSTFYLIYTHRGDLPLLPCAFPTPPTYLLSGFCWLWIHLPRSCLNRGRIPRKELSKLSVRK